MAQITNKKLIEKAKSDYEKALDHDPSNLGALEKLERIKNSVS